MCAQIIDARVKQKTGTAADFAGYTLLEGEIALVRTSASGPVWNFKVGPGLFDSLDWSLQNPGAAQKADTSTVFPVGVPGLYIPTEDGTYEGVTVDLSGGYVQLIWDGSALVKAEFPIDLAGYATVNQLAPKVNKDEIGLTAFEDGENIAPFLALSQLSNDQIFQDGFLRSNGTVGASSAWRTTIDYHPILPGQYTSNLYIAGNASMVIYDSNHTIIQTVQEKGNPSGTVQWTLDVVDGAMWFKTSRSSEGVSPVDFYLTSVGMKVTASDGVFVTPKGLDRTLQDFGFILIPSGTNLLSGLTGSDLDDSNLWGAGYLHYNGTIVSGGNWRYSLDNYRIYPGKYRVQCFFGGNARLWILNESGDIVRLLENTEGSYNYSEEVDFAPNEHYLKVSFSAGGGTSSSFILCEALEDIHYYNGGAAVNVVTQVHQSDVNNAVAGQGISSAIIQSFRASTKVKDKFPVITFISDDGRLENLGWYKGILDDKDIKSTFAIITGRMGTTGYMNAQEVKGLFDEGHDIAGHTVTHRQTGTLPVPEQEDEIKFNKISLMSLVGPDSCPMFVAPFGSRTIVTDRIIRKYFDCDFVTVSISEVTAGTCCNTPPIDTFLLKRVGFDASDSDQSVRLQLCMDAVDVCLANNEWLVFAIHPQFPEYSATGNPTGYEQRRQGLADLIDYIKSLNIPIMTARDAFSLWKNPVELGNRRMESSYYEMGMDGSEAGIFFP